MASNRAEREALEAALTSGKALDLIIGMVQTLEGQGEWRALDSQQSVAHIAAMHGRLDVVQALELPATYGVDMHVSSNRGALQVLMLMV